MGLLSDSLEVFSMYILLVSCAMPCPTLQIVYLTRLDVIFIIGSHSYYHQHRIKHHQRAYSYHTPGSKCRLDEMFEKFKFIISFIQIREVILGPFFSNIPMMSSNSISSTLPNSATITFFEQADCLAVSRVSPKMLASDWSRPAISWLGLAFIVCWRLIFVPLWYNFYFFTQNIFGPQIFTKSNLSCPIFFTHCPKKAFYQSAFLHNFLIKITKYFLLTPIEPSPWGICVYQGSNRSPHKGGIEWVNRGGWGPGDGQQKSHHNRRNSVCVSVSQILSCWVLVVWGRCKYWLIHWEEY